MCITVILETHSLTRTFFFIAVTGVNLVAKKKLDQLVHLFRLYATRPFSTGALSLSPSFVVICYFFFLCVFIFYFFFFLSYCRLVYHIENHGRLGC